MRFKKGDRVQLTERGTGTFSPKSKVDWKNRVGTVISDQRKHLVRVVWDGTKEPWTFHETHIRKIRYQSHKEVWALRIAAIEFHKDGSATIMPADEGFAQFRTVVGWADRFHGTDADPGIFVQYEDGYTSWSPTGVFEKGYTRIVEES